MSETPPSRALITEAAAELLRRLQARHGALMFHQSGGCCDGSSPMCYLDGEFLVGDRDVLLSITSAPTASRSGSPARSSRRGNTPNWLSTSCRDEAAGSASRHPEECGS